MKDGEIRLEEAFSSLDIFRNGGFQGGDDEYLGSFINGTEQRSEDSGVGDVTLVFQKFEEGDGFLYSFFAPGRQQIEIVFRYELIRSSSKTALSV